MTQDMKERPSRGTETLSKVIAATTDSVPATADIFPPAGSRRWWAGLIRRCPLCQGAHLLRSPEADALTGQRRVGCGRRVEVIAR